MEDALRDFSIEQIDGLRDALLKRDVEQLKNSFIDLGKPPQVPYKFQKFPMLVYKHEASKPAHDIVRINRLDGKEELSHVEAKYVSKTVNSEDELKSALDSGYREDVPLWDDHGKLLKKKA